jgi:hypothetical protein
MQTHIVPVGFDYDRLIAPLIRDQFDVDHVILLEGAIGGLANVEYSRRLSMKLEKDFQNLLGAETERVTLEDVYDYDAAFERAYGLINECLDQDSEVWVNVSAMPRPVSFAFATAAHSITLERQTDRDRIHTYYTAPEKYLETELAEELRTQVGLLEELADEVRQGGGPRFVEARTYRFKGHSMSDPVSGTYRSKEEVQKRTEEEDPIRLLRERLFEAELLTQDALEAMDAEVQEIVDEAHEFADQSPTPSAEDLYTHVWARVNEHGRLFLDGRDR